MVFVPGQSGNPAGRPKGALNKRTQELNALIEQNGWKYPVRHFVEIYNNPNEPPERRDAAARDAAPYLEYKRGILQHRYIVEPINVPNFTTIEQAQDFQKEIASRAASGELELQSALDVSTLVGNWIRSKQNQIELEIKQMNTIGGPTEQVIRIEGGLPALPGTDIIMPEHMNGHATSAGELSSADPSPPPSGDPPTDINDPPSTDPQS